MIALALATLFTFQGPEPKPAGGGEPPKVERSSSTDRLETWDDRKAKLKVRAFEKALKPKKVSMKVRKDALDTLVGGKNRALVKPLQKFVEEDSSIVLKRQAVEMLGRQPERPAHKAVLKLLKNARVTGNPQVQAGLIAALSKVGYVAADWKLIDDVFEEDYDTERVPVHEAILDLVKKHEEKQALPLLLRNLDEPTPANVEAADNPPTEYWKARWESWNVWKGKVKDALFAITGQRFSTAAEAKAWLKKNGSKLK